jgi:hypothetical protein
LTNAIVDHMISLTIFIAALLIFIGLFSGTMQTGLSYQRHASLSTKTSDILDTMLLNPGIPDDWGKSDNTPIGFGLQNSEYTEYKLSSYSPMRLTASAGALVYYPGTSAYYSNVTTEFGGYLLAPVSKSLNYSAASKLLGINGTYGFQLSLTPTITVTIIKTSTSPETPLKFSVNVDGTGFPLANANLTYSLIVVNPDGSGYPSYAVINGNSATDKAGSALLTFGGINGENQSYSLIVYSYLYGLKGMGYYVHVPSMTTQSVVPLVDSFQDRSIRLAHSDSVGPPPTPQLYSQLSYNASFVILTEEYTLRQVTLEQPSAVGEIDYGPGYEQDYTSITVPNNEGILIVTYKSSAGQYGLVLMPWGLGSMAFPVTFGDNPAGQDWVTTDIRQVTIGGIAYQAKLELWSLQGIGGI